MGIENYSTTAATNSASPPNGWPEGMAPSAVNDTGRQMMADIRAWYESAEWINYGYTHAYASSTSFTIGGGVDRTSLYHVGRRIKAVGFGAGTIYGTISSATYSAPTNTIAVAWDTGSLSNESLAVYLHILAASTGAAAVQAKSGTQLVFPGTSTAPAGWTINGTNDSSALRVRSSASTSTGGSLDFTTAFAASRISDTHVLTLSQVPADPHTHGAGSFVDTIAANGIASGLVTGLNGTGSSIAGNPPYGAPSSSISVTITRPGSNGAVTGTSASYTGGGGGVGHSHGLPSFAVKYVDCCICTKI